MFNRHEVQDLIEAFSDRPLELLRKLGGYYQRPPDGPLVAYTGTYKEGEKELHFVGEEYANFAKAEKYPVIMHDWSLSLLSKCSIARIYPDVWLGAPEGGKSLANILALSSSCQYVYPDVRKVPNPHDGRPKKEFFWDRHELEPGYRVAIVEDAANNFSTTEDMIELVLKAGCTLASILCILNRSSHIDDWYESSHGKFPVISLERKKIPEYRQDDPRVAADIAANNIVWKPKAEWDTLAAAMNKSAK